MRYLIAVLSAMSITSLGCGGGGGDGHMAKTGIGDRGKAPGAMAQENISPDGEFNTEQYDRIAENPFQLARQNPLSTFSIDVDTASYSNVRRYLTSGSLPPADAVRIEELVNYFSYDYAPPEGDVPFATHVEVGACPWNAEHRIAQIGLKGREIPQEERGPANLVFLLDVSGSMGDQNKLPLLQSAMSMLVTHLGPADRVGIVVYAGRSGLVLPSTACDDKATILAALDRLQAGGSTNGGEGIELAYAIAREHFDPRGINRVILCTDGDFNVGVTHRGGLTRLIEEKATSGIFLTVLGFGRGNLKDATMEELADRGNGNYAYIDSITEARKVLVEEMGGTLVTIAKDVKIQVEFNPALVGAYRLIGYENRLLRNEDFKDDTKDAGEIGAGHTVTALYELVPAGKEGDLPDVDPLKYQQPSTPSAASVGDEILTVKLRYKLPAADTSSELVLAVSDPGLALAEASGDFRFAASVAGFGMLLRDSRYQGDADFETIVELAQSGRSDDSGGYRTEFIQLAKLAAALARK